MLRSTKSHVDHEKSPLPLLNVIPNRVDHDFAPQWTTIGVRAWAWAMHRACLHWATHSWPACVPLRAGPHICWAALAARPHPAAPRLPLGLRATGLAAPRGFVALCFRAHRDMLFELDFSVSGFLLLWIKFDISIATLFIRVSFFY